MRQLLVTHGDVFTLGEANELVADGAVYVWWGETRETGQNENCPIVTEGTAFALLGPDGSYLAGWPRGAKGMASAPVVGADGTLYYTTERGNTYALDRTAKIRPGWPIEAINPSGSCCPCCACEPRPPVLGPDGNLYFITGIVEPYAPDGTLLPGWPWTPPDRSLLFDSMDTPSGRTYADTVISSDGTVFLSVFAGDSEEAAMAGGGYVVALDTSGQVKPGWPYRLSEGERLNRMVPLPNGYLLVSIREAAPVLVPADLVFGSRSAARIFRANSNGAACHSSPTHAVINGIYETVERDALMLAWLNRMSLPRVLLSDADVDPWSLRRTLKELDFDLQHVDISTDLEIPALLAVLRDRRNPAMFLLNMVSQLDPQAQLTKLYRELAQFLSPYLIDRDHFVRDCTRDPDPNRVVDFPDHLAFYQTAERNRHASFLTSAAASRLSVWSRYSPRCICCSRPDPFLTPIVSTRI